MRMFEGNRTRTDLCRIGVVVYTCIPCRPWPPRVVGLRKRAPSDIAACLWPGRGGREARPEGCTSRCPTSRDPGKQNQEERYFNYM